METINFTTRVLGRQAADRLKARKVTQTIRSASSSIVAAIILQEVNAGDRVSVVLDGAHLGYAVLISMHVVSAEDLTPEDAKLGGFDNRFRLLMTLQRAGYRFKPIDKYRFFPMRFEWEEELEKC